jgi:predicted protein tyrosine phosphatase
MENQDPYLMNRLANVDNRFQQVVLHKRVLCVCSAGLLRSPTAAFVLSQEPWNYNTRAAGLVPQFALVPVDDVLLEWADEVVCMSQEQADEVTGRLRAKRVKTLVVCLNIPDSFSYRDPELVRLVRERYSEHK